MIAVHPQILNERLEPSLSIVRLGAQHGGNLRLRCRGFRGQLAQCVGGITQKVVADGPFAADEPSDRALINPEAAGKCGGATKQLNTVGEMIPSVLHAAYHRSSSDRGNAGSRSDTNQHLFEARGMAWRLALNERIPVEVIGLQPTHGR